MRYHASPFVKWAGGKRQILNMLKRAMPDAYGRYYEPFLGGGALMFSVQPSNATVNDANQQLINAYRRIRDDTESVIEDVGRLDSIECDRERYLAIRSSYNAKIKYGELDSECAAMLIFLNKHCFNGLYRVNKNGMFNVPYNNRRRGSSIDANNIRSVAGYLRGNDVEILNTDFEDACEDVDAGDFVYFDPPYVPLNATSNFTEYGSDGFSADDQRRLADLFRRLDAIGAKVMLSNSNAPAVHDLYHGYFIHEIGVSRFINSDGAKRFAEEVIITNYSWDGSGIHGSGLLGA